jgi:Trypsin
MPSPRRLISAPGVRRLRGGEMTFRRLLVSALGLTAVAAMLPSPAGAITGGTPDTVHTNVGLVRFTTPDGRFRCSGTLISPTVVLTAGHCTEGPATDVYVSFDFALQPDPLAPSISAEEQAARAAHYITGTAHPDPGWTGKLLQATRSGHRRPRRAGNEQVAVDLAGPAASGRVPRRQSRSAKGRDLHPGRLWRRHRREEVAGGRPGASFDDLPLEERR